MAVLEPPDRGVAKLPFESSFDNRQLSGWQVLSGIWTAESGVLETQISRDFARSVIEAGSLSWTDYSVELDTMYEIGANGKQRSFFDNVRVTPLGQ